MSELLVHELVEQIGRSSTDNVPILNNIYTILFINGEYKGVHCLKENINEDYYASYLNVDSNSIVEYSNGHDDITAYDDLNYIYNYMKTADPNNPENYDVFCSYFDIDNFIDYVIIQGFFGNYDLYYNVNLFKSDEYDGKYRYVLYDQDRAFNETKYIFYNVFYGDCSLITNSLAFLKNSPEFRTKLFNRYSELLKTTLSNESILSNLESLYSVMQPEMERDLDRFNVDVSYWEDCVDAIRKKVIDNNYEQLATLHFIDAMDASSEEIETYFDFIEGLN